MVEYVSRKECAGSYIVTIKGDKESWREAGVERVEYHDGVWWVAHANWTNNIYSDPMYTKREAMEVAKSILVSWTRGGNWIGTEIWKPKDTH